MLAKEMASAHAPKQGFLHERGLKFEIFHALRLLTY